ncbi:MAG: hypothetical protein JXR88_04115 [Clostridia bacterium]|nr:hypothetical protein [Clostridia bacterium]
MKLKQSIIGIIVNFVTGIIVIPMLLIGTYFINRITFQFSVEGKLNIESYTELYKFELIPIIVSLLVSIFLTMFLIEVFIKANPQFYRIEGSSLVTRTLFTKHEIELSKCRVMKTESFFKFKNISNETIIKGKKSIYL